MPACVSIVSGRLPGPPVRAGTVTVQAVSVEQLVGAGAPPTAAWTIPSALKRFTPDTVTTWPGLPPAGLREMSRGVSPGAAGC